MQPQVVNQELSNCIYTIVLSRFYAENLLRALEQGQKLLTKAFEEEKWELIRSQEGVYFLQEL